MELEPLIVALIAVRHAMSRDDTRANLCGVLVRQEAGRLTVVATDGHRLARVVTDVLDLTAHPDLRLTESQVSTLCKIRAKDAALGTFEGAVCSWSGQTLTLAPDVDRFPPCDKVIPGPYKAQDPCVGFNARYMADAFEAARAACQRAKTELLIVEVRLGGTLDPARIDCPQIGATFVVMPCRL